MRKIFTLLYELTFFAIPFIGILIYYLIADPFMVLYNYSNYNQRVHIQKNVDFISTEKLIRNSKTIVYDSFIFGASTTFYINPKKYKEEIKTNNEVYAFNASGEHINGIWSKIKYLDDNCFDIDHALLVFDTNVTFGEFVNHFPMSMKHYEVYKSSKLSFHYRYFLDFISYRYLVPYIHYELTKQKYPYMDGVFMFREYEFDKVSNGYTNFGVREEMENDSLNYYKTRQAKFKRNDSLLRIAGAQIDENDILKLQEIKEIFSKHGTKYKIMISPAYEQIKFNSKDLSILIGTFGQSNVFDFSGKNSVTDKMSNFYDAVHFKSYVGDDLIHLMYKDSLISELL